MKARQEILRKSLEAEEDDDDEDEVDLLDEDMEEEKPVDKTDNNVESKNMMDVDAGGDFKNLNNSANPQVWKNTFAY